MANERSVLGEFLLFPSAAEGSFVTVRRFLALAENHSAGTAIIR